MTRISQGTIGQNSVYNRSLIAQKDFWMKVVGTEDGIPVQAVEVNQESIGTHNFSIIDILQGRTNTLTLVISLDRVARHEVSWDRV